jgi:hypothetical protein
MGRRLLNAVTAVSLLAACACAAAWAWEGRHTTYHYFGVGRGYRTFAINTRPRAVGLTLTRYATPLTDQCPDAPLIHERGYGWFVGDVRRWGYECGDFYFAISEADYDSGGLFMTDWVVQLPYWVAIGTASALPAGRVLRRFAPRQRTP